MRSKWSIASEDSFLSIGSRGSTLSIGSVGSVGSIGSIGSAFSAFSIASALSVGSAMSALGLGSVMSAKTRPAVLGTAHSGRTARWTAGQSALIAASAIALVWGIRKAIRRGLPVAGLTFTVIATALVAFGFIRSRTLTEETARE